MKVRFRWFPWGIPCVAAALLAGGCSSSGSKKSAEPAVPVGFHYDQPKAKTNPNVVEETGSYYVTRYKKSEMVRVDADHVRPLVLSSRVALRIYREDETYYYIRTEKFTPEEIETAKKEREEKKKEKEEQKGEPKEAKGSEQTGPILTEHDFDSIVPERGSGPCAS